VPTVSCNLKLMYYARKCRPYNKIAEADLGEPLEIGGPLGSGQVAVGKNGWMMVPVIG